MLLSFIVFLPLAGGLLVLLAGGRGDRPERAPLIRNIALLTSLVTFAATLYLWWRFDPANVAFQFEERYAWIPDFGIQYFIGVDGISLLLLIAIIALAVAHSTATGAPSFNLLDLYTLNLSERFEYWAFLAFAVA